MDERLFHLMAWGTVLFAVGTLGVAVFRMSRLQQRSERFAQKKCVMCGYDLRSSVDRCPECGFPIQPAELPLTMKLDGPAMQNEWPQDSIPPRKPDTDELPVWIYSTDNKMAANLLISQLLARGVAAQAESKTNTSSVGYDIHSFSFENVVVWSGDADKAIAIIRQFSAAASRSDASKGAANADRN